MATQERAQPEVMPRLPKCPHCKKELEGMSMFQWICQGWLHHRDVLPDVRDRARLRESPSASGWRRVADPDSKLKGETMKRDIIRTLVLLACFAGLCFLAIRVFSEDPPKPAPTVTLKPGDEVKPLELESAKLGKLKAEIARDEAQESALQSQYNATEADKRALQVSLDALVQSITARVKKETGAEIVYDARTGEDGTFHVNSLASPPAKDGKK